MHFRVETPIGPNGVADEFALPELQDHPPAPVRTLEEAALEQLYFYPLTFSERNDEDQYEITDAALLVSHENLRWGTLCADCMRFCRNAHPNDSWEEHLVAYLVEQRGFTQIHRQRVHHHDVVL